MLNTIYDMVTVIKGITLFPTPSEGAKCAPNLPVFHKYLEDGAKKNDTTIKQFVSSIAKIFMKLSMERLESLHVA